MPPIRQTQSYLRSLFAENGISPQRRLGQNFLIDLNLLDVLLETAQHDGIKIDVSCLESALRKRLNAEVEQWAQNPGDAESLQEEGVPRPA